MRFQVSQVMDAIEQRLTTDVTGAQAVVDLDEVIRYVALDGGRPVNLVRVGMVVDALSRYLLDGGALLYGVVPRALLSEGALTSKERMVLSRWADDGLIEVTAEMAEMADRAPEVARLTGLPLVAVADPARRVGQLLRLSARNGIAVLTPVDQGPARAKPAGSGEAGSGESGSAEQSPVVGRAKVPVEAGEDKGTEEAEAEEAEAAEEGSAAELPLPVPVEMFGGRGVGRVRVSRHRWPRVQSDPAHADLLGRQWRCDGFDCPAFGDYRRTGQPVPRLRGEVPVCPKHDQPVTDAGPRPPAYPVSIVVDDLPRRRLVVREGEPVLVGSGGTAGSPAVGSPDSPADGPVVASVAAWLHKAAANWISPVHLRLAAGPDGLVVTDESEHGTMLWLRSGPDDPGTTRALRHESHLLGEWDSVELYTGIELVRGDRRRAGVRCGEEPASVLMDAPTAAHQQLSAAAPADR